MPRRSWLSLLLLVLFLVGSTGATPAPAAVAAAVGPVSGGSPGAPGDVFFIENVGQFDPAARFVARVGRRTLWLADREIWLAGPDDEAPGATPIARLRPAGAAQAGRLEGSRPIAIGLSYLAGPAARYGGVPAWGSVAYRGLLPGLDLEVRAEGGTIVWRWIATTPEAARAAPPALVATGAAGAPVALSALGLADPGWAATPLLAAPADGGDLTADQSIGTFVSALGGGADDLVAAVALDRAGAIFAAGTTRSPEFPATTVTGPARGGGRDAFIAKITPDGRALSYVTIIGGPGEVEVTGLAIDAVGAPVIAGHTGAATLPTTPGVVQPGPRGDVDGFVARLTPDGRALAFATYLGGARADQIEALALDRGDAILVAGTTWSDDLPVTPGAPGPTARGGGGSAFVARLAPDGRRLDYATYLAGNGATAARAIGVDGSGAAVVVGATEATDLPVTAGALQPTSRGGREGFVVKVRPDGRGLVYGTYLGGEATDEAHGVAVEASGLVVVVGTTASDGFPVTPGAAMGRRLGDTAAFAAKISADGRALVWSTLITTPRQDRARAVALDSTDAVLVVGQTDAPTFPVSPAGYQRVAGGDADGFLVKIDADGGRFLYATYLGGEAGDEARSVVAAGNDAAVVGGWTEAPGLPLTRGSFQTQPAGRRDGFVARLPMGGGLEWPPLRPLPPVRLGEDCRVFLETGEAVCGPFRRYWEQRGGLGVFGYPISGEVGERDAESGVVRTAQYFERARFEYHPDLAATGDEVLLGLLGRITTRARASEPPFQPVPDPGDGSWFAATGHTLRAGFRQRWEATGGLVIHGYPISEEFRERNTETGLVHTVQYFERSRFEYHPEHRGTEYEVLLGHLGRQVYFGIP